MQCNYLYLQVKFNKRFDGAASTTVVIKQSENNDDGSSPSKTFFFYFFFIFCFRKEAGIFFAINMFAEKMI